MSSSTGTFFTLVKLTQQHLILPLAPRDFAFSDLCWVHFSPKESINTLELGVNVCVVFFFLQGV